MERRWSFGLLALTLMVCASCAGPSLVRPHALPGPVATPSGPPSGTPTRHEPGEGRATGPISTLHAPPPPRTPPSIKTLEPGLARLLIVGFAGTSSAQADQLMAEGVGGLIFHRSNIVSRTQITDLTAAIRQAAGRPVFLAVDQEPGRVTRLDGILPALPTPEHIGAVDPPVDSLTMGQQVGRELAGLGFNMDFAPDLDVLGPPGAYIGDRSYGHDPEVVAAHGVAFMHGLRDGGVMAVIKHFPGHGGVTQDSHLVMPVDDRPLSALAVKDLVPFDLAIEQGAPAVMTDHLLYPRLDPRLPASLSPQISGWLLRLKLAFKGLVMTDDLEMGAISSRWSLPQAVVMAIQAGADMALISSDAGAVPSVVAALRSALEDGTLPRARVAEALAHIDAALRTLAR